jgi:hypothetical protein
MYYNTPSGEGNMPATKTKRNYTMHTRPESQQEEPIPYKYWRLWGEPFTVSTPDRRQKIKSDGGSFN